MNWYDQLGPDLQERLANLKTSGYRFCWRDERNIAQLSAELRGEYVVELYRNGRLQDYIEAVHQPSSSTNLVNLQVFITRWWKIHSYLR